jgi:hypothetical protein
VGTGDDSKDRVDEIAKIVRKKKATYKMTKKKK